jgi:lipase chaperone LimK
MRKTILIGVLGALLAGCYSGVEALDVVATPRSLAGTDIDGALRAERGTFVFDEMARAAFDYFLTADEELTRDELDAWVGAELTRRVPDAADEAIAAWHAYVAYRTAAAAALTDGAALAGAEQRLVALVSEHLGDYPIAARERTDIARAFALQRASALTGAARDQALAGLAADEPLNPAASDFIVGRRAVELARLAGAGPEELQAVRTEHFGADAAGRLAALDARRAQWEARLAAYSGEREALLAGFAGTPAQRDAAVRELEAMHFSPAEARRVHALAR